MLAPFNFSQNKYTNWYTNIIAGAQIRRAESHVRKKRKPESIAKMLATREHKRLLKLAKGSVPCLG